MFALEVKNLIKTFNGLTAVNDVSFTISENSIFGLIGRNGAGKTTTIRMMMNIYLPDSGEVILRGTRIGQDFRNKVGYLPEERGLYKQMKVLDTLLFFAEVKGKTGKKVLKKADEYLERFGLLDRKNSKVEDLSKGNQQKLQFITTILHDPDFLILDEPFSGLDPVNINIIKEIILDLKRSGKVIIFSTHLMDFAEKLCDEIAMIDHGKMILSGSLPEIKNRFAEDNITLSFNGDISFLRESRLVESIEDFGNTTGIKVKKEAGTQALLKLLVENNINISRFDANQISLHDIFIKLAGKEE